MKFVTTNAKFLVGAVGTVIVGVQCGWDWSIVGPSVLASLALWGVPNTLPPKGN